MKSILCNERCNKGYEWCNHLEVKKLLRESNIPNVDALLKEMFDYENNIWEEQIEEMRLEIRSKLRNQYKEKR